MKASDRIVIALGVLDLAYIAWTVVSVIVTGQGIRSLLQNLVRFGVPYPGILVTVVALVYVALAACGVALILRRRRFAWLNYALLPFRLALVMPTLFIVYALLAWSGIALSALAYMVSLVVMEVARCVFIFYWHRAGRKHSSSWHGAPVV